MDKYVSTYKNTHVDRYIHIYVFNYLILYVGFPKMTRKNNTIVI
ncbi:hypothetical protein CCYN49044_500008 [Capnocytophaga cynodegmi]|uniref:Uncharacterized protein n=1 Tax=Capnocytophaga cynodegmi TaxID=28189 RepID=A0A0B7H9N5_9FLAO|nr:hypothetical protein CCYN74_150007 [Capnocytophaga cynodegmi]CEN41449.1 hypothetical protein CCYN49044_500008 [Capnocytophaga cynodegmi]